MTHLMNGVILCAQEWVVHNGDSGCLDKEQKHSNLRLNFLLSHLMCSLDEMKSFPHLAIIFQQVDHASQGLGPHSLPML